MSRRRGLKIALAVLGALGLIGVVAALVLLPGLARRMTEEKAREHGVELSCAGLSLRIGRVLLADCEFSLVGLSRIHGSIRSLEVSLSRLSPAAVQIDGMDAQADGSLPTLALGVTEWTKSYPQTYRLPTSARAVSLEWRQDRGGARWLRLESGALRRTGSGASFRAEHTLIGACTAKGSEPCPNIGSVGAAWTADDAVVMLGFGEEDVARAPVRVEVKYALAKPTAVLNLAPVKLEQLAGPFGVALPVKDVIASATVQPEMPKGREGGVVTGSLTANLKGYVPPHPHELDGFVFGDVTTLESKLNVDEKRERAELSETKVTAGAFKLAGNGSVAREGSRGRIKLELRGNLPCDALAGAAADSYLGKAFGGLAGQLAKRLIGGNVGVTVKIDALSDDLERAKVDRIIGIGCGLKPLKLSDIDLSKLPIPPLPSGLPPLPSGLPPLPSGLPPPPQFDFKLDPPKPNEKDK